MAKHLQVNDPYFIDFNPDEHSVLDRENRTLSVLSEAGIQKAIPTPQRLSIAQMIERLIHHINKDQLSLNVLHLVSSPEGYGRSSSKVFSSNGVPRTVLVDVSSANLNPDDIFNADFPVSLGVYEMKAIISRHGAFSMFIRNIELPGFADSGIHPMSEREFFSPLEYEINDYYKKEAKRKQWHHPVPGLQKGVLMLLQGARYSMYNGKGEWIDPFPFIISFLEQYKPILLGGDTWITWALARYRNFPNILVGSKLWKRHIKSRTFGGCSGKRGNRLGFRKLLQYEALATPLREPAGGWRKFTDEEDPDGEWFYDHWVFQEDLETVPVRHKATFRSSRYRFSDRSTTRSWKDNKHQKHQWR